MDQLERAQIRLILEHLGAEYSIRSADKFKAMFTTQAAKGLSRSGSTVAAALKVIGDEAAEYVEQAVDQVAAVTKDIEAFALIISSLTAMFRIWQVHVEKAADIATKGMAADQAVSIRRGADRKFVDIRSQSLRGLEIHRFTFTRPSPGDSAALLGQLTTVPISAPSITARSNVGGKPLAAHWDDMWSSIAVQLYVGDLQPQTQADIENAIKDWFSRNDLDIGDTAVRQRARQLWGKLDSAK